MADRKRLSENEESEPDNSKKRKLTADISTRPLCKYGAQCYRKNPDHLKAYHHPTPEKTTEEEEAEDNDDTAAASASPAKITTTTATMNSTISLMELLELDGAKLLSQVYQMEFPSDLYEFWKFCSNMNETNPRDALKDLLNLQLVGPFEILDGALKTLKTLPNMHLHYRYYYDAPEFMTFMRTSDPSSQFHIGYYRDSPDELPCFVASNDAIENSRFKMCGENIFAAIHLYARQSLKSSAKPELKDFLNTLEAYAKKHKYSLEELTPKINARKKKVCCTLFSSLGMVVPVENDIGYRPIPFSKDQLKKVCDKFCNGTSESICQAADDELQNVITCVQFANDECDYGEGLEFGLDLFLYGSSKLHSRVLNLLPLAYTLLHRNLYGQIIKDHLLSGRSNKVQDLNEIDKNK